MVTKEWLHRGLQVDGGERSVTVIVVESELGYPSLKPERGWLYFTYH